MLVTCLFRVVRFICRCRDVDRVGGRHTLPSSESFRYVDTSLQRKLSTMVANSELCKKHVNQQHYQKQ